MSPYQRILSLYLDSLEALHAIGVSFDRRKWSEAPLGIAQIDPESTVRIDSAALAERVRWLREKLRRYPFWSAGHVALATVSLRCDDIGTAYASAIAALKITERGRVAERARIALGRAYLRRGDPRRAIETFETVLAGGSHDYSVIEDLAAAYLAEEKFTRTIELLESIPESDRSGEGITALSYARKRHDGVSL